MHSFSAVNSHSDLLTQEGQFLKLMCPTLGLEWHSFTMTSLPADPFLECIVAANGELSNTF
jgi:hypothetical protein